MNNPKAARRGRGRQQNKNGSQNGRRVADGNNRSEQRIRGNPIQLLEKYKSLARDATTAGDRILAENYFQHADHYQRVVNERQGQRNAHEQNRPQERAKDHNDNQPGRPTASGDQEAVVNGAETSEAVGPAQPNGGGDAAAVDASPTGEEAQAPAKPKRRRRTVKPKRSEEAAAQEVGSGGAA